MNDLNAIVPRVYILRSDDLAAHEQRLQAGNAILLEQARKRGGEVRPVDGHPVHGLLHIVDALLVRGYADAAPKYQWRIDLYHADVKGEVRPLEGRDTLPVETLRRGIGKDARDQGVVRVHNAFGSSGAARSEGYNAGIARLHICWLVSALLANELHIRDQFLVPIKSVLV